MLDQTMVLKNNELFLVGKSTGDHNDEPANGLYTRDTRHLSLFTIRLNQHPLECLSVRTHGITAATITYTNPQLTLPNQRIVPAHAIGIHQDIHLTTIVENVLSIENYTTHDLTLSLTLEIAADFRDIFDIRGFPRKRRGQILAPEIDEDQIVFSYRGLDGSIVATELIFDELFTYQVLNVDRVLLQFDVTLLPGHTWSTVGIIAPHPADARPLTASQTLEQFVDQPQMTPDHSFFDQPPPLDFASSDHRTIVTTDDLLFNQLLAQSTYDLLALETSFPEGVLPAAGIPWYVAPFGRDSIITALQTLHSAPQRAVDTLRTLGALQGTVIDPIREEQPGKILHEMRYGEMARLSEIPHTPYYGSIDATPLFVLLFAETINWTGDRALYNELLPNVRRALEWIRTFGDVDGDGFVEYRTEHTGNGYLRHQVWKDSSDSLNHLDGTPVTGAIAAVEVQGYIYAAYDKLAALVRCFDDDIWATELSTKADVLRQQIEKAFWVGADKCYAQALDSNKQRVRTCSSNAGHLLYCGVPSPSRASKLAKRLMDEDMQTGWGIRTLSSTSPTFNPMSYHNGSVWPHDNSLIGAGFFRYGLFDAANLTFATLFDAARTQPLYRLPELYCGFPRSLHDEDAPVAYPVSCSPQAWAAGAMPLLVRSMLGLEPDLNMNQLSLQPMLPSWLNSITITDMSALGRRISLSVRRQGERYVVDASEPVIQRQQ